MLADHGLHLSLLLLLLPLLVQEVLQEEGLLFQEQGSAGQDCCVGALVLGECCLLAWRCQIMGEVLSTHWQVRLGLLNHDPKVLAGRLSMWEPRVSHCCSRNKMRVYHEVRVHRVSWYRQGVVLMLACSWVSVSHLGKWVGGAFWDQCGFLLLLLN